MFAPRSLLTLGDWKHLFLTHLQDVSRLDQVRDTKKPSEPISSSSSTDEENRDDAPNTTFLSAARRTVLTLPLCVLVRDSQVVKVCGSFSVVNILNPHTHKHIMNFMSLMVLLALVHAVLALAHLPVSRPDAFSRCPCQSEIQPPLRAAPTKLSREIAYLFCSMDRCCKVSPTLFSQQSHGTLEKVDMPSRCALQGPREWR